MPGGSPKASLFFVLGTLFSRFILLFVGGEFEQCRVPSIVEASRRMSGMGRS